MGRVRERVRDGWNAHTGVTYESSVNHFLFILLFKDCYRATSRHWIILLSPCFSAFAKSGIISRHWIILVSSHFSPFMSLVQVRLFSTSQPRAVKLKASTQSGIMTSSYSASFLCCHWVEIFLGLYNFLDTHEILVVTPPTYLLHVDTTSL